MKALDIFRCWLLRHAFRSITKVDYSLKPGDIVRNKNMNWRVQIIDINWALLAASVKLNPENPNSGTNVWPVWNLEKENTQ